MATILTFDREMLFNKFENKLLKEKLLFNKFENKGVSTSYLDIHRCLNEYIFR